MTMTSDQRKTVDVRRVPASKPPNTPTEPRIIERWGYARPAGPSTFAVYDHKLLTSREAADEARRQIKGPTYLARFLIEVPR